MYNTPGTYTTFQRITHICHLQSKIQFIIPFFVMVYWDDQVNEKTFYSIFEVGLSAPRREINLCCKWDWNSGPFDLQSSALTNRLPATPKSCRVRVSKLLQFSQVINYPHPTICHGFMGYYFYAFPALNFEIACL